MEESRHKLYDHDKLYYELLDEIEKGFKEGKYTEEEKQVMVDKATLDESELRRKDISFKTNLFNTRQHKDETNECYYQQCINAFCDEMYIKCIYTLDDLIKASSVNYSKFVRKTNEKDMEGTTWNKINKRILDDLNEGKLDILNTSGEELFERYVRSIEKEK